MNDVLLFLRRRQDSGRGPSPNKKPALPALGWWLGSPLSKDLYKEECAPQKHKNLISAEQPRAEPAPEGWGRDERARVAHKLRAHQHDNSVGP